MYSQQTQWHLSKITGFPTIRGRETGIWNRVYLNATGLVTVENPLVSSVLPLPDTTRASVTLEATLNNHSASPVSGTLRGRFGDQAFDVPVALRRPGRNW